jgi:putative ABC transport system permease protein
LTTMGERFSAVTGRHRFYASLVGMFGGIAAGIAAIGIYGVVAYAMSRRTREFGIRLALGAKPRDVLGLVLRHGTLLVCVGVLIGLAGAAGMTRYLSGMLFGLTPVDLKTYSIVAAAFAGVALLASFVPARRATKVDPVVALRYE